MIRTDRPGYLSRNRKAGRAHYWSPQRAIKGAPPTFKIKRLPDDLTDEEIAEECQRLTNELRAKIGNPHAPAVEYNGTIDSLIELFRTDPTSSFHTVKHSTRVRDYGPSLRIISKNVGKRRVDKLQASDFRRWYSEWRTRGHRRAAGIIKLLRLILTYGAGERLPGCKDARDILSGMRFEQPPARRVAMTYDQCRAIVLKSAEMGHPSVGFVEALKFESALRRIDVIGEWAPDGDGPFRWRGLTVGQISKDHILTITTSKTGAAVSRDLSLYPLVQLALESYTIPEVGPVVIDENTGKPYWENRYTTKFRAVREAAGVPAHVWSMDTRAGAVTETVNATGSLDSGRDLATHTTVRMTAKYNRGDGLENSRVIALARAEKRGKAAE
ncbi:MAG: hypothetical protein RIA09_05910 [Hoeflea sp.]|uniref:hypothetical protein n=1 Tax=Hoeflea sp. TaxID=1940281 RepID=UPI0032EF06D1